MRAELCLLLLPSLLACKQSLQLNGDFQPLFLATSWCITNHSETLKTAIKPNHQPYLFRLPSHKLIERYTVVEKLTERNFVSGMWPWGSSLCLFYVTTDVFLCSASIVHMSVISFDRYWGISRPLKTRNKSKTVVALKICSCWLITVIVACPITVLGLVDSSNVLQDQLCQIWNRYFQLYGSALSFFIPLIIMAVTYAKTVKLLKEQQEKTMWGPEVTVQTDDKSEGQNVRLRRSTTTKHRQTLTKCSRSRNPTDGNSNLSTSRNTLTVAAGVSSRNSRPKSMSLCVEGSPAIAEQLVQVRAEGINSAKRRYSRPQARRMMSSSLPSGIMSLSDLCDSSEKSSSHGIPITLLQYRRSTFCSSRPQTYSEEDKSTTTVTATDSQLSPLLPPTIVPDRSIPPPSPSGAIIERQNSNVSRITFSTRAEMSKRLRLNLKRATTAVMRPWSRAGSLASEQKATKVLGVVFFCFFVCWTPFFAMNTVIALCQAHCSEIPQAMASVFLWLGYISSTVNPIIYTTFNRRFRSAFFRLLKCHCEQPPVKEAVSRSWRDESSCRRTKTQSNGVSATTLTTWTGYDDKSARSYAETNGAKILYLS